MMADSGDRVEDHVEAVDSQESQETSQEKQQQSPRANPMHNDEAHLDPSRWWFASSAFPLIAGTLGPVANAFSICALVRPWRQEFPPGSDIEKIPFIPDPVWCVVLSAPSQPGQASTADANIHVAQAYRDKRHPVGHGCCREPGASAQHGQED
jgi:hypothetical protein